MLLESYENLHGTVSESCFFYCHLQKVSHVVMRWLTAGISSPVERLAMYESALSQVFMLCSYGALGYDGKAAGTSGVNGGSDEGFGRDLNIVRIRTYWCKSAFTFPSAMC